ncbi:MAG: Glyoxylate/hydroxypyruvate reductase [Pseudomonadota bacterium]|jgi:glyoxylate/hydroxypyruvate reductase A
MKIVFCCTNTKAEPWLEGFRQALPGVDIWEWQAAQPGHAPKLADHAVVWSPPQSFIDEQSQLQNLFNIGAGVDALLKLNLPASLNIVRLNDAGMSVQMAEYVCHAVIRHFREFDHYDKDAQSQRWSYRKPSLRADFAVGVLGAGVLGSHVAKSLQTFEFPVNVWSRSPKHIEGVNSFTAAAQLPEFLKATRVLVNLLPLTPDTENILNREHLLQLQHGAYLINVARGRHLVEQDLIDAIDAGHMAGATLDVFRQEPLPPDHAFWSHPKITVTPHTSARTLRDESIAQIASKIKAVYAGQAIEGRVDKVRGY